MKKLVIFIGFVLLFLSPGFGQLNSQAQYIRENFPNQYEQTIRKYAVDEWGTDYTMIVYEINKQSEALFSLIGSFESQHTEIVLNAIREWSHPGYESHNLELFRQMEVFDLENLMEFHCNWPMVKYIYDRQVKAKESF